MRDSISTRTATSFETVVEEAKNSYLFSYHPAYQSAYLDSIQGFYGGRRISIIACCSFDSGLDKTYENIAIKKIPQMLLDRCEFGKPTTI